MLHIFLDLFLEQHKPSLFLFTMPNGLPYLLIVINIPIRQDRLKFLLALGQLLLDSILFEGYGSKLLFLLLILVTTLDAGL